MLGRRRYAWTYAATGPDGQLWKRVTRRGELTKPVLFFYQRGNRWGCHDVGEAGEKPGMREVPARLLED
jgi:hypothetical protein